MICLNLTEAELLTVAAALHAVSPTGGGSTEYTLARKVSEVACHVIPAFEDKLHSRMIANCNSVVADYLEAQGG